ncbi:tyrosine-type recombinase/integrase [bacterium]|nr:tyrosine-type recombinase/integrase [bacterium]
MRTIFRWLNARGELESVLRFPTVAKRKHVPNVIAPEDQERVLAAIPEVERGIYIMAVEEVFRPGELRALNVAHYDFKARKVTLKHAMDGDTNAAQHKATKEEDVRVHRVSDRMAAWLETHVPPEERLKGNMPLFVNPDGRSAPGGRYNAQALRLGWKRAAKSVSLGHVRMYEGTKHSTLTEARRRGAPLDQLQKAAGHKDPRSTEVYAQLAQEEAAKVLRLVRRSSPSRT